MFFTKRYKAKRRITAQSASTVAASQPASSVTRGPVNPTYSSTNILQSRPQAIQNVPHADEYPGLPTYAAVPGYSQGSLHTPAFSGNTAGFSNGPQTTNNLYNRPPETSNQLSGRLPPINNLTPGPQANENVTEVSGHNLSNTGPYASESLTSGPQNTNSDNRVQPTTMDAPLDGPTER